MIFCKEASKDQKRWSLQKIKEGGSCKRPREAKTKKVVSTKGGPEKDPRGSFLQETERVIYCKKTEEMLFGKRPKR